MAPVVVRWSDEALLDIDDVCAYVSQKKPENGEIMANKIDNCVTGILKAPYLGRKIPEYNQEHLRERIIDGFRLLYRITPEPIVELVPQLLELKVGEPQTFRLESRQADLNFKVTNVGIPFPELEVKFLGSPKPGTAEFEASLTGPAPAPEGGATVWSVPIETDIPGMPPFNLYLRGAPQ